MWLKKLTLIRVWSDVSLHKIKDRQDIFESDTDLKSLLNDLSVMNTGCIHWEK
jgi:hypothetical protein